MYKLAWIPRFDVGVTGAEPWEKWSANHAGAVLSLPNMVRYTHNRFTPPEGAAITDGVLGYACAWWPNRAAFELDVNHPAWADVVRTSRTGDLDPVWSEWGSVAEVTEHLMRSGLGAETSPTQLPRAGSRKVTGILRFKHGMAPTDAFDYWEHVHGTFPLKTDKLGHYAQNHVTARIDESGAAAGRPAFDGFSEAYFADEAAEKEATTSPGWHELQADAPNLLDRDFHLGGLGVEVVLKPG